MDPFRIFQIGVVQSAAGHSKEDERRRFSSGSEDIKVLAPHGCLLKCRWKDLAA